MTDHTLPDDVLERAAIAANRVFMSNYEVVEEHAPDVAEELSEFMVQGINAALPILIPAIETALLERMLKDFEEHDSAFQHMEDVIDYVRAYRREVTP